MILVLCFSVLSAENILEIDAGTITMVSFIPVRIRNSSNSTLEFRFVSICDCLVPQIDKITLGPQKDDKIIFKFDPGEYSGEFENYILVYSGGSIHTRIKINAFIDTDKSDDEECGTCDDDEKQKNSSSDYFILILALAPVIIVLFLIGIFLLRKKKDPTE